jgi:rare lipoprotein A
MMSPLRLGAIFALLLSGCATQVAEVKDGGPRQAVDVSHIPDAIPRKEVRTRAGNRSPYTLFGKTYHVLDSDVGFRQKGMASWYGSKFHGRRTANGEIYDMYGMTAAHKTLPIPSYVRVTNLNNHRSVVVRVNDRGPFHGDRIIDLTYTAAAKLGFIKQGTAPVSIEALQPGQPMSVSAPAMVDSNLPKAPTPKQSAGYQLPGNTFLQAGAFSRREAADGVRERIAGLVDQPVAVVSLPGDELFRVRIGPIADNLTLMGLRELLQLHKLPSPHVVYD